MPQKLGQQRPSRQEIIRTLLADSSVDKDLIKTSYWALNAQNDKCAAKISRWLTLGVVAVVLFELLNRRLINQASFSSFQIDRLTFLPYVIPPFVALAFLNVMALIIEGSTYTDVADEMAKQAFPAFESTGMTDLFHSNSGLFGAELPASLTARRQNIAMNTFYNLQAIVAPILYLAFEAYAFTELFKHFGPSNLPTYLSLIASASLLALTIPFIANFAETS